MKTKLRFNHVFFAVSGVLVVILSCLFTEHWNPEIGIIGNIMYKDIFEWACEIKTKGDPMFPSSLYKEEVCYSSFSTKWGVAIGFVLIAIGAYMKFNGGKNE